MVKHGVGAAARAIASAPRRAIIERLAQGPASMTELAEDLGVSLPAIDKHLRVLLEASVVSKRKDGRVTLLTLNPGSLDELATWAMSTRLMCSGLLDRFAASVEDLPPTKEHDR